MDKMIIEPTKVRAYGNILAPKLGSDFETYMCGVSEGTDTVDGVETTVFTIPEYLFIDRGTSSSYSTDWTNNNSYVTVTRSSTETTLTRTGSNNGFYELQNKITDTCTIEADLWLNDTGEHISLRHDSTVIDWVTLSEYSLSASTWYHFKIKLDGTTAKIYVDGVLKGTYTYSNTVNRWVFRLNSSSLQIKYKNFMIY